MTMKNPRLYLTILHVAFLGLLASAQAQFTYTGRLGFSSSPEFTSNSTEQGSSFTTGTNIPQALTETGRIFGRSTRYSGGPSGTGFASWTANGTTGVSTRIGLFDQGGGNQFTGSGNLQTTITTAFTNAGFAAGTSARYLGDSQQLGNGFWLYRPSDASSVRVGFFTGNYISSTHTASGQMDSATRHLNEAGQAIGYSNIYNGGASVVGQAAWVATAATGITTRIGLTGAGYITNAGAEFSGASDLSQSGYIVGDSTRAGLGLAAWVARADTGATTRIGLFGATEFTSGMGFESSGVTLLGGRYVRESSYVAGSSNRYNGGNSTLGTAAWVASGATGVTQRVGLYDQSGGNEFTRSNGLRDTLVLGLTESGKAVGFSLRFNGTANDLGQATWAANGVNGTTTRVGFFSGNGSEFTSDTGYQFSNFSSNPTETDLVIGSSFRFNGLAYTINTLPTRGFAAWVANVNTGTTTRLGFFSANFTQSNGFQSSSAIVLTNSGFVGGNSTRFSGNSDIGTHAWIANAGSGVTTRVGLTGGNFTSPSGLERSTIQQVNEAGTGRGSSVRYNASNTTIGQGAWQASSNGTTTRIGLFTANFTQTGGTQFSETLAMNSSGAISGRSYLYAGSNYNGEAAWVASSNGTTTRVGLTSAVYSTDIGGQISAVTSLVNGGFVAGYSNRYNGNGGQDGQTAWVYDIASGLIHSLEFSVRPSDGFAFSEVIRLFDDGFAVGNYTLFSGQTNLGSRPFAFLPGLGAFDLGTNMNVSLTTAGWDFFNSGPLANSSRLIAGFGDPLGASGAGIYLLSAVPEPSTWALLGCGVFVMAAFHRRKRRAKESV